MAHPIETMLPALRRFAYSLTGNRAEADDLVQNTVEKILTKPCPTGAELLPWAFRVCRNQWIDDYRAKKVRHDQLSHEPSFDIEGPDESSQVVDRISLQQVAQAMQSLPENQREVLSLVAVEGLSYQEASTVLAVPTGTIMSRLARARSRLCDYLQLSSVGASS